MKINIKASGVSRLQQNLKTQISRLHNLKPFWQLVGMYVQRRTIKERFDKEQSPDGTKWQALSPARIKQRLKRHKGGSMKILQDTGELRRSVQYEAEKNYVRIGSNLKYARIHQFGGRHIPARPFLGVTNDERRYIIHDMFEVYLKRHVFTSS